MSETQNDGPTIHELMGKVMAEIDPIAKGQRNTEQGFNYRGIDDVFEALNPIFAEHGVYLTPRVTSLESERYQTSRGTNMRSVTVWVEYVFHGPAGDHTDPVVFAGEAADAGDKAIPKALAQSLKYMLLHTFLVPTKDSTDGDADSPEAAPPKEAQIPPGIDPNVQGWLDNGIPEQKILEAAKEAARKHGGRVARTLEQIKPGYLKEETLRTIASIVQSNGAPAAKDPPGCSDHDPFEPSCPDCQHVLKQRREQVQTNERDEVPAGVSKG